MPSLLLVTLLACGEPAAPPAQPPPVEAAAPTVVDPVRIQLDAPSLRGVARPDRIAARHILISYQGLAAIRPKKERNRDEALALAQELLARIQAGEDFALLARQNSDDASALRGGDLGAFDKGVMVGPFEQAAFALDPRFGLSEVVESEFGFHIIQRYPLEEIRVLHIVVQHAESQRTTSSRSREEARARVDQARLRILAGEDPTTVVRELSDGPSASRGGDLGWFQRGQMLPQVDEAAFALDPGQLSEPIESPAGYHLVLRLE